MRFNTPLRYPGGKGKLTDFMKAIMQENDLLDGEYAEPYAGGAGIAINLLVHNYASRIHLNDINPAVHAFWRSVIDQPEALCKAIRDVRVTMKEWHAQKAVYANPSNHTPLELGFATFFLNRTNRSGILWAGVIGGKNQDGPWKIDARFEKDDLISRIQKIALYGARVRVYNLDAEKFIQQVVCKLPAKSLTYLDPPYYVKGADLYENHYAHADHLGIAKLTKASIKTPWIVSYDHVPEIAKMYAGHRNISYGLSYSAQDRYKGSELIVFSKKLKVPKVNNPAQLKVA